MTGRWFVSCLSGLLLLVFAANLSHAFSLQEVERDVAEDYPSVTHALPQSLIDTIASEGMLLLDVRELDEFAVSHIDGATRVPPDISRSRFLELYGGQVKGRQVVFYCSVGVRSSQLADYVRDELMKRGARDVINLRGGIFRWHNEQKPLRTGNGATDFVHPFDRHWGSLVNRSDKLRYRPAQ